MLRHDHHFYFSWQLYNCQIKVIHEGEETERFNQLTIDYMSDEENDHEILIVHRPHWRSRSK